MAAVLLPLSAIPPRWGVPLLTLAALAAPALRTLQWRLSGGPTYSAHGYACPLSAEPWKPGKFDWLVEINWGTISAELSGWPTGVMALGLCATLALRGGWGACAAWVTVALFVVFAGVFSLPYAVRVILDDCRETLEFGGWDIVRFGPILHYSMGAVLATFLALVRRAEAGGGVPGS
ncbi:hypothetical protein ACIBQ6_21570 [Nonomuraea sp. NPDC049655]|uniref:hypothetical protein n=1 Tax=Nonomuraea sp. NPDC049655 TaxID=3364355 RepID=UPI003797B43B